MKNGLALLFFILAAANCTAQTITEYKPALVSKDSVYLDEKKYKKSLELKDIPTLPKDAIADLKNIYYVRKKSYLANVKDHEYIIDPKLTTYLNTTFETILTQSGLPEKDSFKIHLTRSPIPNAYSTGDWNIFFNIGLLKRMENESQVAFVICHELAHQLLDHTYKHLVSYLKTRYSKEFKSEIKDVQSTQFETADKLVQLLKKKTYDQTSHSREDEKGADSLGLIIMMKTRFDARESIRSMEILDSLEGDTFNVDYKKYLDGGDFKFKSSWLEKSKTLSFGGKAVYELDEDSAKTHPDCAKREIYLKEQLSNYRVDGRQKDQQPHDKLTALTNACKFEEVEYVYYEKRYARCMFLALHLSEEFPNDAYPVNMVINCLGQMVNVSKDHKLYDCVAKPAPNFQENYNQLLRLFDRVTMNDIASLNNNYAENNEKKFGANPTFTTLLKDYHLLTHKF